VNRRSFLMLTFAAAAGPRTALASAPAAAPQPRIAPREVQAGLDAGTLHLVDIREADEWLATGVPPQARLIALSDFEFDDRIAELAGPDRAGQIALLCRTGERARRAHARLAAQGFRGIFVVAGGLLGDGDDPGWIAAGLPLKPYAPSV
jgi:rhodanese-related sulfurtransferase